MWRFIDIGDVNLELLGRLGSPASLSLTVTMTWIFGCASVSKSMGKLAVSETTMLQSPVKSNRMGATKMSEQ